MSGHMKVYFPTTTGRWRAARFRFNVHIKSWNRLSCFGFIIRCARMDYAFHIGLQSFSKWKKHHSQAHGHQWRGWSSINGCHHKKHTQCLCKIFENEWLKLSYIWSSDALGSTPFDLNQALTLLRIISGARYSGVPQSVQVRPFTLFANPKSVTWEQEQTTLLKVHWWINHHGWLRTYLYVTLLVNKKVLGLQISVDEVQRVKVFKGQYNLGCVKAGVWFTTKKSQNIYT